MSLLSAIVLIALAASGAAGTRAGMDERIIRTEAISLAKRQAQMWEAAVKNDWEGLYSLVLPRMRKEVSLFQYMENPRTPSPLLGVKISGATTPLEDDATAKKLIASGTAPQYRPTILRYRFQEMHFSPDSRRAVVISNISISAAPFLGPTSTVLPLYDFWVKDAADGIWYADLASTTLIHTSGAATGHDPMEGLSVKADPALLAATLVEEARAASEDQMPRLLEDALWLDVPGTVRRAEELHMGHREMLRSHLDRVFAGMWKNLHYFPVMMEAAPWYQLIGDDAAAYECYRTAAAIDMDSGPARAGSALAAARTGHWPEAAGHYLHLLRIDAARRGDLPALLEPYLSPHCRLCENVPAADGFAVAARLCNRGDYVNAAAIYRFYAERHPGFADALARLRHGKELTLTQLLGEELARESGALTYHDASGLLHALGLRIAHPDDIPAGGALPQGGVTLRSSPPLPQTDFTTGYFTYAIPAAGDIRGKDTAFSRQTLNEGGWLLASVADGTLRGGFHPDDAKGQNPAFAAAVGKIKKGETLFVVRVGIGPVMPDTASLKALEAAGVDTFALPKPIKNLAMAGIKGGKRGSARVFTSDIGVFKMLDAAVKDGPGAVRISGSGPGARVRLGR